MRQRLNVTQAPAAPRWEAQLVMTQSATSVSVAERPNTPPPQLLSSIEFCISVWPPRIVNPLTFDPLFRYTHRLVPSPRPYSFAAPESGSPWITVSSAAPSATSVTFVCTTTRDGITTSV